MVAVSRHHRARKGGRSFRRLVFVPVAASVALVAAPRAASGQSGVRSLPATYRPGDTIQVVITLDVPPGPVVVALQDSPPAGWTVSNISHSGTWDTQLQAVKWGPFLAPPFPAAVTYDVTVPGGAAGQACFAGSISFNGPEQSIGGDACLNAVVVPAASTWALAVLTLTLATAGTLILHRQRPAPKVPG